MRFIPTSSHPTVVLWCVNLRHDADLVSRSRSLLTPHECARANAFGFQELRDNFVLCRGALRVLLSRFGCGAAADLRFTAGFHGKPELAAATERRVEFNLSHSGGMLACAFARQRELGVDIERHRPIDDYADIARRFFSAPEVEDLMSIEESGRQTAFYDCWVRKEAVIKALGGGLSVPLDSFRVSLAPADAGALLDVRDRPDEARSWTLAAFSPAPHFSGAVACRDPHVRLEVHSADIVDVFAQS
jgi:4'-phosphopantetheinyl transferase